MSLVDELIKILHGSKYSILTFYLKDVLIVTVIFTENKDAVIITDNMCYKVPYNGVVNSFVSEVYNMLVYSGVDELVRKSKGSSIEFDSEPYLYGEITQNMLFIEQDADIDDMGEGITISKRYGITAISEVTSRTLAEVIGAFAYQNFS